MNCSTEMDLKAYVVGELERGERSAVEDHLRVCASCSEELDRLNLTRAALATLEEEEIPRRIAFVSDRVFEPRWWQTMWHSGPTMGFASAVVLAAAIVVHAAVPRPPAIPVNSGADAAVVKELSELKAQRAADLARFDQVLKATETRFEHQRQEDLASFQQVDEYRQKQMNRILVASNGDYRQ
jgi:anti-sigma factor RsiW